MMANRQYLIRELEATKRGLQQAISTLRKDLTKLQQMLEDGGEWDQYQYDVWTKGAAAKYAAEIAGLLSRQRALQEVLDRFE